MAIIMCRQGGLMEDPAFHWEQIGEAEGTTLREACDNLAKKDPEFAKYYNPETISYWGWKLALFIDK